MTVHALLDPTRRPVVGHRGNSAHAPENTIESFLQAVSLGVDALEMDVRLTADGEVVVIHDPTVDRTTDGTGAVRSLPLAELRGLDAGARCSPEGGGSLPYAGRGVGIPTFAEVLERVPEEVPILIEIKVAEAAVPLRRVIEEHGAETRCIVASFDGAATAPFRDTRVAIGASQAQVARLLAPALFGRAPGALPYRFMAIPRSFRGVPLPIRALARAAARAGVLVHIWTVNDPAVARALWRSGVRGIIADDPAVILAEKA